MPYDGGLLPLLELGGVLAVPVALLLALGATLAIAIALRLRAATQHDDELLQRVEQLGRQDRLEDAAALARATPGAAAAVIRAGLAARAEDAAEAAMADAAAAERARLARGTRLLDWAGALAVLVPAAALALGDRPAAALAALAFGLGVAIPVALARWAIVAAARRAELDMRRAAGLALDLLGDDAASR